MIQMCTRLLIGILGGLWLSLEESQCWTMPTVQSTYTMSMSYCYNTSSGKSCFMTDLASHSHQMPILEENVGRWCNSTVPGSSLVIINGLESQGAVRISMGRQVLAHEKFIIIDAQSVSTRNIYSVSFEWSYVVDLLTDADASAEPHDEDRKMKREVNHNDKGYPDKPCWESRPRHTLAKCVGHVKPQYRYICENSGAADTQTQFGTGRDRQCICISHLCINKIDGVKVESDSTWRTCHCHRGLMPTIVCRKVNEKFDDSTTKFADTDEKSQTTSAGIIGETVSTASITQSEPSRVSGDQAPAFAPESSSRSTTTFTQILLILLAFLVVAFIVVAIILIIRKRKFSGRNDVSMTRTNQNEAASSGYETTVRENHYEPSAEGVPIYTELELTQEPAPSNNTVYSSVQPTGEAVDMGKRVVYAELDNVAVVVSPVYSQPFEAEASASNAEYAEPFKPDTKSTATAPVANLYDNIAAVDQQSDVYSLAKEIPLSDPNVIYSQPNKPGK